MKVQVAILLIAASVQGGDFHIDAVDVHFIRNREPPVPLATSTRAIREQWVEQRLDHFNEADTRTFQMRYYNNDEFFQPGAPLFIFVGGEYGISPGWLAGGHMFDMARDLNGHMFYVEHRFYGRTRPTADLSVGSLQYLNIDQAIEDLAEFIKVIKSSVPGTTNSGVILVGASYSATVVSVFRQRYPEMTKGAWASSAPLHATVDFGEFKVKVGESIALAGGQACYDRIERAFNQIAKEMSSGQFGWLDKDFNTCTPLANATQMDIWNFYDTISGVASYVVQSHYILSQNIQNACNVITNPAIVDDVTAYAEFVQAYTQRRCVQYDWWNLKGYFSGTTWESPAGVNEWRQWMWQTCNEFGMYQVLTNSNSPFGARVPSPVLYTRICSEAYSHHFSPESVEANAQRTNARNNGRYPVFTNVFSTHGQLDPWRAVGVQQAPNAASPVTIIPMASHANDLYSLTDADPPAMREVKMQIRQLVEKWLQDG